jgi:hypothetical protein
LFAHSVKPEHVYRHQWREHDLVFWDNRSLLHLAAGTPDQLRRVLYRTTIEGDRAVLIRFPFFHSGPIFPGVHCMSLFTSASTLTRRAAVAMLTAGLALTWQCARRRPPPHCRAVRRGLSAAQRRA